MHLIYIDDSADEKLALYSALAIPVEHWRESFSMIKEFRSGLRKKYGIYVSKELHAWKFVSGRGNISDRVVSKYERVTIFNETLDLITKLPNVKSFNAVFPKTQMMRAYERLINRINRTLGAWNSHGILVCDKGNELAYTQLVRKMGVYNPIPSAYNLSSKTGVSWRNIPIDRIVEDPFFKPSDQSFFIQLCDFSAYALLRRENPLESKSKYGLDKSFEILTQILVREANRKNPYGIICP
jgi:hypothetical protein